MEWNRNIHVYIEKSEGDILIIDFINFEEYDYFLELTGFDVDGRNVDGPSMILINNYQGEPPLEDDIYRLNTTVLNNLNNQNRITLSDIDSYLIGYEIDMEGFVGDLLLLPPNPSQFSIVSLISENIAASTIPLSTVIVDELKVRDVGQGNWNELYNNQDLHVIFDIGASWPANKTQVNRLVRTRLAKIKSDQPTLVISHWDADHYHCLRAFSSSDVLSFSNIFIRNVLPTLTSQNVHLKLSANTNIYPISTNPKPSTRPQDVLTPLGKKMNNILLFNAAQNSNRNREGLSILVDNANSSAVLTGDLYYRQVSDHIYSQISNKSKNYLVVPHHGGNSGKYKLNLNGTTAVEAIISVGSKPHVKAHYVTDLKKTGFSVSQTDKVGSRSFKL